MNPTLSIIIPLYHEPFEVVSCLAYLASCPRIGRCEIILASGDGDASMPPTDILPIRIVSSPAGRGVQLNTAASEARGHGLVFLHVDTRPPPGFVSQVEQALASHAGGAFDLCIHSHHPYVRLVSLVGRLRSRLSRVPYGDQTQFVRRSVFREIGGFPETVIMEDVGLMDRLRAAGHRITILRAPAVTSGRRWVREGPFATTFRNWRIMLAYRAGVPPRVLRGRYRPHVHLEPETRYLLVFHRALRPGAVKTRLARAVGEEAALELYRAMVEDLRRELSLRGVRIVPCVDRAYAGRDLFAGTHAGYLSSTRGRLVAARIEASVPQHGADLWERMADAIERAVAAGAEQVVLVGSDIPGLTRRILRLAYALLGTHDLVVGPSADGGFYLVGTRSHVSARELLTAAGYGGAAGAEPAAGAGEDSGARLLSRAQAAGLRTATLPVLRDVDTLQELREVLAAPHVRAPRLRRAAAETRIALIPYTGEKERR